MARSDDCCSCRQFCILSRKNWLLKSRKPVELALEILLPPLFMLLVYLVRSITTVTDYTGIRYNSTNSSGTGIDPMVPSSLASYVDTSFPVDASNYTDADVLGVFNPIFSQSFLFTGEGYSTFVECNSDWFDPLYEAIINETSAVFAMSAAVTAAYLSGNETAVHEQIVDMLNNEEIANYVEYRSELAKLMTVPNDPSNQCWFLKLALVHGDSNHPSIDQGLSRILSEIERQVPNFTDYVDVVTNLTSSELDDMVSAQTNSTRGNIGMAIVLDEASSQLWSYTIRLPDADGVSTGPTGQAVQFSPSITSTGNDFATDLGNDLSLYTYNGFITTQLLIDAVALSIDTEAIDHHMYTTWLQLFPTLPYRDDEFWSTMILLFGLILVIGLMYPVINASRLVVHEKDHKIRAAMVMMSMNLAPLYASWIVFYATLAVVEACLMTIVCLFPPTIFQTTALSLAFVLILLTVLSSYALAFCLTSFFREAKTAALVTAVAFFVAFLPFFGVYDAAVDTVTKAAFAWLPPVAFSLAYIPIAGLEGQNVGAQWSNLDTVVDSWSLGASIGLLVAEVVVYTLAGIWLDQILPTDYTVPKCCCAPCCCCCNCKWHKYTCSRDPDEPTEEDAADSHFIGAPAVAAPVVEEPSQALIALQTGGRCVEVKNLVKRFKTKAGVKTAVDGMNLTMYEGQVTALLGHNGAGKTTTISMLTGMLRPTSGSMRVLGMDVESQLDDIRNVTGICPQHNILFDELSCEEHLELFGVLKGIPADQLPAEITKMIKLVGLEEKRKIYSKNLSGGMKRKLSVGIALLGTSRAVFLDEPTSGMDPHSRRFTWELIKRNREGRTIVLTTHFMDEADILGDRIAIMAEGNLQCCGSSTFLKNEYGIGYSLTVVTHDGQSATGAKDIVKRIVASHINLPEPANDAGAELLFRLPLSEASKFPSLFKALDLHTGPKLQGTPGSDGSIFINEYGVSVTTLEEVFLRVGGEHGQQSASDVDAARLQTKQMAKRLQKTRSKAQLTEVSIASAASEGHGIQLKDIDAKHKENVSEDMPDTNNAVCWQHSKALFLKRAYYFSRDKKSWCCQIFLPAITFLVGLVAVYVVGSIRFASSTGLLLSVDQYNDVDGYQPLSVPINNQSEACLGGTCGDSPAFQSTVSAISSLNFQNMSTYVAEEATGPVSPRQTQMVGAEFPVVMSDLNTSTDYSEPTFATCSMLDFSGCMRDGLAISPLYALELNGPFKTAMVDMSNFLVSSAITEATANFFGIDCNADLGRNCSVQNEYGRYGGFIFNGLSSVSENLAFGTPFALNPPDKVSLETLVLVNSTGSHAGPAYINLLHNAWASMLRQNSSGADSMPMNASSATAAISTFAHPWTNEADTESALDTAQGFVTALFAVIAMCFVPGTFVVFVVRERQLKQKHQQLISGISLAAYWTTTFVWDLAMYISTSIICLVLIAAFDVEVYTGSTEVFGGIILVFLMYGLSVIPFTYVLSFVFKEHSAAQNTLILVNLLLGAGLTIASYVLDLIEDTQEVNEQLIFLYRIFPGFCLGDGLLKTATLDITNMLLEFQGDDEMQVFDWDVLGANLVYMGIEFVVFSVMVVAIEVALAAGCHCKGANANYTEAKEALYTDDVDVEAERQRVESGNATEDVIVLKGVRKIYPTTQGPKVAVRNLSVGIPSGECFGLLGINGAGKTTTLSMLSAEFQPTKGSIAIAGHDIVQTPAEVKRLVGFCPQFDAIFDLLTGEEHLRMYGTIKGLTSEQLDVAVPNLVQQLGLQAHAKRQAGGYSGGNKRKLSVAIAMIGNPKIVFLDEPSTGMDPVSRRKMWEVIADISTRTLQTSVILTTHSMEECEALCSRIAIMVGGRFRCIGSNQHLKDRFGKGYSMDLLLNSPSDESLQSLWQIVNPAVGSSANVEDYKTVTASVQIVKAVFALRHPESGEKLFSPLVYPRFERQVSGLETKVPQLLSLLAEQLQLQAATQFVHANFPGSVLVEEQGLLLRFDVPRSDKNGQATSTLGQLFELLENNKQKFNISSYSLSQTTLEQIFNTFAAQQEEELSERPGAVAQRQVSEVSGKFSPKVHAEHSSP